MITAESTSIEDASAENGPHMTGPSADQQAREKTILDNEKKITEYQQKVFGTEGIIAKKQEELLKPFTDKVNKAISNYATANNLGLVIDLAATSLPYYAPSVDITEQIIKSVK